MHQSAVMDTNVYVHHRLLCNPVEGNQSVPNETDKKMRMNVSYANVYALKYGILTFLLFEYTVENLDSNL